MQIFTWCTCLSDSIICYFLIPNNIAQWNHCVHLLKLFKKKWKRTITRKSYALLITHFDTRKYHHISLDNFKWLDGYIILFLCDGQLWLSAISTVVPVSFWSITFYRFLNNFFQTNSQLAREGCTQMGLHLKSRTLICVGTKLVPLWVHKCTFRNDHHGIHCRYHS